MPIPHIRAACLLLACFAAIPVALSAQQPSFAVATIRPSSTEVPFDRDGKTETWPGSLHMQAVTVTACLKWAYGVQNSQISGPDWLQSEHYDILAKADAPATDAQMKTMMQALLADRFKLTFHRETKELKAFALTVAKSGAKFHEAASDEASSMQNTATGAIAKAATMQQLANLISGPLQSPVTDETGLQGKYDFVLDFASYVPEGPRVGKPDPAGFILPALQGELGLKLEARKTQVEVMVIDHIERPSAN